MLAQSVVPVDARIDVPHQLAPHVETAVYFVVAEALTNIAKHSGADLGLGVGGRGRERGRGAGGGRRRGRRAPREGQGLAGLGQRLAAVDGTLDASSPDGGPTVLVARIPLAAA